MDQLDQTQSLALGGFMAAFMIFALVLSAFFIVVSWRIFTKAGQPGWACLIPIYSAVVQFRIIGKPWWWIFLCCIPVVNIYFIVVALNELSKSFGKDTGFTVGLFFLSIVFYPILAFGNAVYLGPGGISRENMDNTIQGIGQSV